MKIDVLLISETLKETAYSTEAGSNIAAIFVTIIYLKCCSVAAILLEIN